MEKEKPKKKMIVMKNEAIEQTILTTFKRENWIMNHHDPVTSILK